MFYDDEWYEAREQIYKYRYSQFIYDLTDKSKYAWWMLCILQKCISREFASKKQAKESIGYVEMHHIVPRSFAKEYEKDKLNIVAMTAREHILVHILMAKSFSHDRKLRIKAQMTTAKFFQTNGLQERIITSRQLAVIRKMSIDSMSGENSVMFGSNGSVFGRKCYTNGEVNMFLKDTDTIPYGFHIGSKTTGKTIGITNGEYNLRIGLNESIPTGYWVGSMTKGNPSKLKGRTRGKLESDERRHKGISDATRGSRFITNGIDDRKIKPPMEIPDGWWYGRTHGIVKMRKLCSVCGKSLDPGNYERHINICKG